MRGSSWGSSPSRIWLSATPRSCGGSRPENRLFVNVTVTTVDVELARKLEPRAPRPDLRLEAVRQLNLAGIDAGVICAPVLPEITDGARDLEALVKAAAEPVRSTCLRILCS